MKTSYTIETVGQFLKTKEQVDIDSINQLVEGHISQAFSFETGIGKCVLRIAPEIDDFLVDKYASDTYGEGLLIPKILDIGEFQENSYYCISEFAPGRTVSSMSGEEVEAVLPEIHTALAKIYTMGISKTQGYGHIDTKTGNAAGKTWKDSIKADIEKHGVEKYRENAQNIGLSPALVDDFYKQFMTSLPFAHETRRLFHGDPAFDNMLIDNGKVTAMIDWPQMGYGDWMSDFARLDFWWPGRYGDAGEFARKYNLEGDHLDERKALYWAMNALWTIEFADRSQNESTTTWLLDNIETKRI
jgi:hygromycin-B 4-O-kinase